MNKDVPVTIEKQPLPRAEAARRKPNDPNRIKTTHRRLTAKPYGLENKTVVPMGEKAPSGAETINPLSSEGQEPAAASAVEATGNVQATEAARIAATEAEVDDVIVEAEAAKAAAAAEAEASSKRATAYAVDRAGVKDPGVPINERFRVVGAIKKSADFKAEFTRLRQAEGEGKLSPQRLKQLQEQAARNCYYKRAEQQIAESGREAIDAVRENPVFKKALERETERAVARAESDPERDGSLTVEDQNDIATRALAEVMAAEDIKNDKSLLATLLKVLAMVGLGTAITLASDAKLVVSPQQG